MMSTPNSLSSLPAVWSATAAANVNQSAAVSSRKLQNPQLLRSSLPNWTRLSGGSQANVNSNHKQQSQLSEQHLNQPPQQLAETYSTPQTASAAYTSGLLKSDDNIASNALRIRLAFRYCLTNQLKHNEDDNQTESGGDDNLLYLCWVRQDGTPYHFRKLVPIKNNHDNLSSKSRTKKRVRRGESISIPQTDETDKDGLIVNEHDSIESTFPGHAFVFCRRISSYNHLQHASDDDDGDDINTSPRVINDENGHTIFLRRKKREQSSDVVESDESSTSSSEEDAEKLKRGKRMKIEDANDCNKKDDDWEAYLVVGGFRPGPMPQPSSSSPAVGDEAAESESNRKVGSDEAESINNDEHSSDDESDDEMELQVQLVTIRRTQMPLSADNQEDHATTSFLRGTAQSQSAISAADASKSSSSQLNQLLDDLKVTVHLAEIDPTPVDVSSKHYDRVTLGGWPCRIEPGCFRFSEEESQQKGSSSIQSRFERDIAAACQSLPPSAREKLQQSTPIWINKSHMWGPRVAPVRGRDACFHPGPGAKWLSRNGDNPAKCGGVEFYDAKHYLSDCDHWGPGGLILHELSHAWHNIHIANGYDNKQIEECYELAMKDGLYDCVRVHGPQGPECKAYACTNSMEYFAELSVAFLGGLDDTLEHNKWFPFNRSQLREHDPRAFDMLCQMWGVNVVDGGDDDETKNGQ